MIPGPCGAIPPVADPAAAARQPAQLRGVAVAGCGQMAEAGAAATTGTRARQIGAAR